MSVSGALVLVSGASVGTSVSSGAVVSGAVVSGAVVSGAVVSGAVVFGAVVSGAVVAGAVVAGAVVFGAVVSGAVVSGAVVSGAVVSGAVVFGAVVSGAVVAGAVVSGAVVSGAVVSGAVVAGAVVAGAVVSGAVVSGAVVSGAVVAGAVVAGAVVSGAVVFGAVVSGAVVLGAVVFGAVVSGVSVQGASVTMDLHLVKEMSLGWEESPSIQESSLQPRLATPHLVHFDPSHTCAPATYQPSCCVLVQSLLCSMRTSFKSSTLNGPTVFQCHTSPMPGLETIPFVGNLAPLFEMSSISKSSTDSASYCSPVEMITSMSLHLENSRYDGCAESLSTHSPILQPMSAIPKICHLWSSSSTSTFSMYQPSLPPLSIRRVSAFDAGNGAVTTRQNTSPPSGLCAFAVDDFAPFLLEITIGKSWSDSDDFWSPVVMRNSIWPVTGEDEVQRRKLSTSGSLPPLSSHELSLQFKFGSPHRCHTLYLSITSTASTYQPSDPAASIFTSVSS